MQATEFGEATRQKGEILISLQSWHMKNKFNEGMKTSVDQVITAYEEKEKQKQADSDHEEGAEQAVNIEALFSRPAAKQKAGG